jgi:hypothetical protein
MVNVHGTPIQVATTRLPSFGLCGVLTPSDFIVSLASWRSILVVTDAILMLKHKKLSHSGLFAKPRILCWRRSFACNTLWQIHKPPEWQCAKRHSLISSEKCYFEKVVAQADIYYIFLLFDSFSQFHVAYEFRECEVQSNCQSGNQLQLQWSRNHLCKTKTL